VAARYYLELFNFCNRYVRDRAVAQDIVQEVYARLAAFDRQGARPVVDLRGLLYQIARNLLIDHHRQQIVRAHESDDVLLDMPGPASDNPEAAYAASQRVRLLVAAIEGLPPRCREAFVLHRIEGLPQAEVAQRMGISRNMVERHIMVAVAACRKRLRDVAQQAAQAPRPAPVRPEVRPEI
jgi:RNA polymerase sigma factor (sigma-70 family)